MKSLSVESRKFSHQKNLDVVFVSSTQEEALCVVPFMGSKLLSAELCITLIAVPHQLILN